jgi:Spy/CpxP family protein refolding chaperone
MKKSRILYGLVGSSVLLSLFAARPIAAAIQEGGGMHRRFVGNFGGHTGRWAGPGAANPEALKEHAGLATRWVLRDLDTTEEQQDRVAAIATSAIDDLFRLKEKHQGNRQAFAAQLGAAQLDRAALEEIRKSEIALADEASKRLVAALADASEVLTPEQRLALVERVHRLHGDGK